MKLSLRMWEPSDDVKPKNVVQMEKNQAAGKTHSSIPMPTPPPLALNLSPKFAPLSLVHTKAFGTEPENNSVPPPSYMEEGVGAAASFRGQSNLSDFRQQLGEDRDDIYSSGAGTLDAIREQMKSIQATAAAGNTDAPRQLSFMNGNILHGIERMDEGSPTHTNVHPMDEKAHKCSC